METPFKAVEFAKHETITRHLMDTMQGNAQWLKDNTPRGRNIHDNGSISDSLTVIVSGRVYIARNKKYAYANIPVRFPTAFDPRCRPQVTTGIVSESARQIFCVVNGSDGGLMPKSTGFDIFVTADDASAGTSTNRWAINKGFYVNWQAMGYRLDDMYDF